MLDPVQQKAAEAVLNEVLSMISRSVVRGIVQGRWPEPPRAENIMYAIVRKGVTSIADQKLRPRRRPEAPQDYGDDGR